MSGRPPVDREQLLRGIVHFQVAGVVWRGRVLQCRPDWITAIREASEAECREWAAGVERLARVERAHGAPLVHRASIVDPAP
jgi:hypothetical protein